MTTPNQWSDANLLSMAAIIGKSSVKTQYACQVISVSEDGRFVDVIHNTLEWAACSDGDTVMINEFGKDVLCSPTKPWIITDVPVEETYERGQWKVRARPRVGDKGVLSVFYHDIKSLKEKGGFQAPDAIRVMAIDSASWRPGLPNHADVDASPEYPSDDEWELNGNGVKIKLTSPVDEDSNSPNKMDVTVGTVQFTIEVPQDGTPTITFNAPNGAINITSATATINADITVNGTITASGEVTGNGIALSAHTHGVTTATGTSSPAPTPDGWPTSVPITTP